MKPSTKASTKVVLPSRAFGLWYASIYTALQKIYCIDSAGQSFGLPRRLGQTASYRCSERPEAGEENDKHKRRVSHDDGQRS